MISKTLKNIAIVALSVSCSVLSAYPLDGTQESAIRRLEGYRLVQAANPKAGLAAGQLWSSDAIQLGLLDYAGPDFDQLEQDPALATALTTMLKKRDPSYSMVLVDITNPAQIRWAGLRPDLKQNPGSVGKLMCMTALYYALANAFPDTDQREAILSQTLVRAGDWVYNEIHVVPKWDESAARNRFSVLNTADEFRLSEWIDHAISASANGAGSVIWREALLIHHFGSAYPVSDQVRTEFFTKTSKATLSEIARDVITQPMLEAGIDISNLRQGSFFTATGKMKVPGTTSYATPRELARWAFRLEQGRLVDAWSSLQMKKYLYLTKRRYRYAYAPELSAQAVFFKSGSLYSCKPEPEFRCGKYIGNKQNLMNSLAIVEGSEESDPHYISVLMSDVMKINSAWDHSRIAAATDAIVRTRKTIELRESASAHEMSEAGRSE